MSNPIDFIVVFMDIIACLISLDLQVNLKTIEEAGRIWFEEAEQQAKFSGATCRNALAAMQHPQFQRLLSFMTTGIDPEGSWKRSINYQEWTLCTAIKKLVKHQFMAANPGSLVVNVDFDLCDGYSVQGRAFPGVKPVGHATIEDTRSVLESYGMAFSRAYPDLISHTISVSGFVESEEVQISSAEEAQSLIAELKAVHATTMSTPFMEDMRKMVEGPIPLSHEEAMAKIADVPMSAIHVKETLNWLSAIKKHLPVSQTVSTAKTSLSTTKVALATEWNFVGTNGKAIKAGAGGGR